MEARFLVGTETCQCADCLYKLYLSVASTLQCRVGVLYRADDRPYPLMYQQPTSEVCSLVSLYDAALDWADQYGVEQTTHWCNHCSVVAVGKPGDVCNRCLEVMIQYLELSDAEYRSRLAQRTSKHDDITYSNGCN